MKLSINQMRAIEAVARTGSFSAAAKELGISQPSVSNHLLALEKHYNTKLVHRNGRTAEPTDACLGVLSKMRSILAMTHEVEQSLEGCRNLQSGKLRLGYSTYQFAMPVLSDFMKRYPDIDIEARAMASHDLMPLLQDGKFDVAFVTAKTPFDKVHNLHICTEELVLVAPKNHPLIARENITWQDVPDYPLIQRERSAQSRRSFEEAATNAGVSLNTVLALGSWGSIVTAIQSGMGIGVAMAGEVSSSDNLAILSLNDPDLTVSHYLVCLPEMQHVAAINAMFATAQRTIAK